MIFDKILKRGGIEFDIILDKDKHKAGQKVKGYLTVSSKKEVKVRGLRLIAEGIESTEFPYPKDHLLHHPHHHPLSRQSLN